MPRYQCHLHRHLALYALPHHPGGSEANARPHRSPHGHEHPGGADPCGGARRKPHLITQVVPSPFTFKADRVVQELLADGYLGDLLSVELRSTTPAFVRRRPVRCTGGRTER